MKLIQTGVVGVCLITSIAVHAQTSNDTTTRFTQPVIVKDKKSTSKGEKMKQEYKSKEWHLGMDKVTDTVGTTEKPKLRMQRKSGKRPPAPPPPPPLHAAPPKPSEKR